MNKVSEATFREKLAELVDRFSQNKDEYCSSNYPEAEVRRCFIDPLFEALGWDISNKAGKSFSEQDVVLEKTEPEGRKRPDYTFRINGKSKFFVEAKAPHHNLNSKRLIYQAKSYAYSTGTVFYVVLTDFEEWRLYEVLSEPKIDDNIKKELIQKLYYTEYLDNIDKLWLLSKEAVLAGSLDKVSTADMKNPVDKAFLGFLTRCRLILAKDIRKQNPKIRDYVLNDVVQRHLDRIVFTRILEDRGIIRYRSLKEQLDFWRAGNDKLSNYLRRFYNQMNGDFNGSIFRPDECDIYPSGRTMEKIIREFYPPKSPYQFSVMPVEILGYSYEKYLGNVIRLTPKQVKLEQKPEVRKAGGVYYTPKYIVDYIVDNTVGKLIEGKTPQEIANIRIVDPACGSGSFLIGAYQKLLDYHLEYYQKHPEATGKPDMFEGDIIYKSSGEPQLSIRKKAEILTNNIFGVDIDPSAVEITRMSLYIKCTEGIGRIPPRHKILPPLKDNIRCGNSLIGSDIHEGELFDPDTERKINCFDWDVAFKDIMDSGGFDCVIGNPPYVRTQMLDSTYLSYLKEKYILGGQVDLYLVFIMKALSLLSKSGRFSFIVPRFLLYNLDAQPVRQKMLENGLYLIADANSPFEEASTECIIFAVNKKDTPASIRIDKVSKEGIKTSHSLPLELLETMPDKIINIKLTPPVALLLKKIKNSGKELKELTEIRRGMEIGKKSLRESKSGLPVLLGEETSRYSIAWGNTYVNPDHKEVKRLKNFSETPKILIRRVASRLMATLDCDNLYFSKNLYSLKPQTSDLSLKYLLSIVNSRIMSFFFLHYFTTKKEKIFPEFQVYQLKRLPIRTIDFSNPDDVAMHNQLVQLVDMMLELNRRLQSAPTESDRERIRLQIQSTDRKIDNLVYKLYNLTEDEIQTIEGSNGN